MRARSRSKLRVKLPAIPLSVTVTDTPVIAANLDLNISACPGCGLEAPEVLMAEHFLGSPSHEHPTSQAPPVIVADDVPEMSGELDADSRSSLRNLLQMLVPPRAFGHRHQEKTSNPLSRLVQRLEASQSALVQPLKGPR